MTKVRSSVRPQTIEFVGNSVLVASNITPYEEQIGDRVLTGFEYDCEECSKEEFFAQQESKIGALEEQLAAAKILLGVD